VGQIIQPGAITQRLDRLAETASVRALSYNAIHAKLIDWLEEHGPQPYRDGQLSAADVRRWKAPAQLAALAIAWRDAAPGDIAATLDVWRRG
jgi:hypothetical protein